MCPIKKSDHQSIMHMCDWQLDTKRHFITCTWWLWHGLTTMSCIGHIYIPQAYLISTQYLSRRSPLLVYWVPTIVCGTVSCTGGGLLIGNINDVRGLLWNWTPYKVYTGRLLHCQVEHHVQDKFATPILYGIDNFKF